MFDPRMTPRSRSRTSWNNTSATRSSRPSSRATCDWPKRRPTAAGVTFDPTSKGAQAYIAFGAEMVERIKTL
jgi:hypothetical protein